MRITINYFRGCECAHAVRSFTSLHSARAWAEQLFGADGGDVSQYGEYAVSADGLGRVTVDGDATINDIFPDEDERHREAEEIERDLQFRESCGEFDDTPSVTPWWSDR